MTVKRIFLALIALTWLIPNSAFAHALEPGYLEIRLVGADSYRVFWRKPDVQSAPMEIFAVLPAHCETREGPAPTSDGQAWVSAWVTNCAGGLSGGQILIRGLEAQNTDVLVRFPGPDGTVYTQRLTPLEPSFEVPVDPSSFDVIRSYLPLGVDHILEGLDHLLFVFALLLLISDRWRLVGAITAFTVAHSITMAAATLGWVALPGPPVEAVIALSIMFLASELRHKGGQDMRLSERYPWTVSFSFGLLHGFGFAGALRDIGLPQTDIPLALLSFNLGVEIGQLIFVAAVLVTATILRRLVPWAVAWVRPGTPLWILSVYAIGGVSAYWFIDRVSGF
ncbi:hydrogenase/urease accessory protein HupE [Shimia isoporae]|uniref:Hydrogenase/urease accessory protein HupE n=1 Tax=Shimia isoporae TaxID=647720 RepID=A0A4R1N089_9RHOB|nr:HupE/UreJ family protein [Shimia isoporae]TCK99267.1 hydrogenase/urease accessory protein HupE [Shimia isoporae]